MIKVDHATSLSPCQRRAAKQMCSVARVETSAFGGWTQKESAATLCTIESAPCGFSQSSGDWTVKASVSPSGSLAVP